MCRVYRNIHIGLISAMVLAAVAFEANAVQRPAAEEMAPNGVFFAAEAR